MRLDLRYLIICNIAFRKQRSKLIVGLLHPWGCSAWNRNMTSYDILTSSCTEVVIRE